MHVDYTAIITFIIGIILPYIKKQLLQSIEWLIVGRIINFMNEIIDKILKKIKPNDKTNP